MPDSLTFEEKLNLSSWGLPEHILQKYSLGGVEKMFPWQVECLMSGDVLSGGNLIYSAPTSAGKTLVAEILAIKTVLERRRKVIIILPFVSVVREKMIYFQEILSGSGIRVEGFMGSYNPPGGFRSVHVAICTIEKANNLINRLIEERNLDDVGTIIVDELHLLGDPNRGYLLELLLTKLKYICQKGISGNIQVIGMSATLPNLDLLSSWMNATLYHTDFRPIPLFEYLKIGRSVYKAPDLNLSFEIKPLIDIKNDPGDVVYLCLDTIIQGYSLLVFCPTKVWCETLAVQISSEIKKIGNEKNKIGNSLRNELDSAGISAVLEQLKKCPVGLEKNLAQSVSFGVAYHHAGLTLDERDIVEGGFKQNIIRVLVATSTLSSGVNLPARRVIIRSPGFQGRIMDILTYKQMIGRAGRMGKDTAGESYLICSESDEFWGKQLLTSVLPPVKSCLGQGNFSHSLKRALLEVIACGVVSSYSEVQEYTKCTLLAVSESEERILKAIDLCTNYLLENEFMKVNLDGNMLPSSLAEACLSAAVPPDQALYLLRELHKAKQCFVLDSDLHAIYQVTPYSICDYWNVDWMRFFTIWENLPLNLQKIGELVGVEDRFLIKAMRGTTNLNAEENVQKISIHKRFYTALALQDLINEVPLNEVALKYDCNKGMLQSLQQSASTFAAMVTCFCKRLGWGGLEVLLSELSTRIQFGVQKDLLNLLRLDCMTALMARTLFNVSITSVTELASSSLSFVHLAVSKAKPFHSDIISCNNHEKKNVYLHGRPGLSEIQAAELLIREARTFLLKEMCVKTAEWDTDSKLINDSVYECSTICLNEQQKNNTGPKIDLPYCNYNNMDISRKNIFDSSESKTEQENEAPRNLSTLHGKNILETIIKKKTDSIKKEPRVDLKVVNFEIPDLTKISPQSSSFSSASGNKLKITDSCFAFGDERVYESMNKEHSKLDDTELINSEFLNMVTNGNKIQNKTEHYLQVSDGDNALSNCTMFNVKRFNKQERQIEGQGREFIWDGNKSEDNKMDCMEHANNLAINVNREKNNIVSLDRNDSGSFNRINLFDGRGETKITLEATIDNPTVEKNQLIKHNDSIEINLNSSTPIAIHGHVDVNVSNNDMFLDSPQLHNSTMKQELDLVANRTLEDFDINWGGDSLLEFSQIETRIFQTSNEIKSLKRKVVETVEELNYSNKKIRLSIEEQKSVIKSEFEDSLPYNTQIEKNININKKVINSLSNEVKFEKNNSEVFNQSLLSNKKFLKLKERSKSEGIHSLKYNTNVKENNSLTETFLSNAFSATYKLSELLLGDIPSNHDTLDVSDLNISDSEDVITGSPEHFQKRKGDLNLTTHGSNNKLSNILYSSPAKSNPISSPAKCSSPMKYPPIGGDIIKISKSPSSKQKYLRSKITHTETHKNLSKHVKNNIQVITVGDSRLLDINQIIENIKLSKEVSFLIRTVKLSEMESQQDKIGGKIMKNINSQKTYKFKFGDEAIGGIYFFDGKIVYNIDITEEQNLSILKELLSLEDLTICGINTKKALKLLYQCCNIFFKCKVFDVGVAEWILNPQEHFKTLEDLSKEFLKTSIFMNGDIENTFSQELIMLRDVKMELTKKMKELNLDKLFFEVEMPLQKCLLSMELTGIGFDRKLVNDLWSLSTEEMGKLEVEAFTLAAQKFSLSSNADFSKIKKKLKILPEQADNNPLVIAVQNWRKLHYLKIKNLSQLLFIKGHRCFSCSSVRSVTGRIIMYDPDLQHIQRDFKINDKMFSLRSAFITKTGNFLVSADYRQLELRILAHFSQDPVLLFLLTKDDVFKHIAAEWNGISVELVSEEMRHQVKQICYGIIYGMGDKTLGEVLGKTAAESSMLSANFKRTFPKLDDFIKKTVNECRQTGKIKSIGGRIRYLPAINSSVSHSRAQSERQAINSKIQGSAADITKKAMIKMEEFLNKTFPERKPFPSDLHSSHLVLQLHDELIYEVDENLTDCFIGILRNVMEKTTVLSVPLPVVIKVGKSWGSLNKV